MTPYEVGQHELARDLENDELEILKEDLSSFQPDEFSSDNMLYEGLALGSDNPFFGE